VAIIGVDPHKSSHTANVLDERGCNAGSIRIQATPSGYSAMLSWARRWPERTWAIEGAHGLGRHLAQFLLAKGEQVVDVPATLSARTRELSTGTRKTDDDDATATAWAALHARELHRVQAEDVTTVIRLLVERRDNLVQQRTRQVNQLHALLRDLLPGGAKTNLTARQASALLTRLRPRTAVGRERKRLARDLTKDIQRLEDQRSDIDRRLEIALREHGTSLTELPGIGVVLAAHLIAHAGTPDRFPSRAHFASYAGVAPVEVASGEHSRHRLSRAGNRQLNCAIHLVALEQLRHGCGGGRAYVERKRGQGKTSKEALRCLKRRLADRIYKTMLADHRRRLGLLAIAS
jgi:transposase